MDRQPEMRALEALDPRRQYRAVKMQCEERQCRSSHRRAAEERDRDAVIELLVDEQRQMRAAPQRRQRAARGDRALRDELAPGAAKPRDHAVDQRVVGGAVDLRDIDAVLPGSPRGDLPISEMPAEDDDWPAARDGAVEMLDAACLDPPTGGEDANPRQMRVFRRDPAEIVPHAAQHPLDLTCRQLG